jgi:PAS domain S-box-containing protein
MGSQFSASADQGFMSASSDSTLSLLNEELARKAEQLQAANNALAEKEQSLQFVVSELRRNRAHLAEAQRLGRMGSVGVDVKTKRIFWSDEAARIYGYPPGTEPTAELILQRSHPDDSDQLKAVLERAALGGCNFDWEHRLLMPDGSIKYLHDVAHLVKDESGREEIVGAIMDVTEQKLAEECVRRGKVYLAEAQRLSRTGSFGWNVATDEIVWSEETFRILGYDKKVKPTMELIFDRIHPEDRASVRQTIDGITGEGSHLDFQHRLLLPDQVVKHVHVLATPTKTETGRLHFMGAVMDITELKQAAEELRVIQHLARGQLDALVDTLAVLAREPKPIKFLEHVYHIICEQLRAVGLVGWETSSHAGGIKQIASYEDDHLRLPSQEEMQVWQAPGENEAHPVWKELFTNPEACAYSKITVDPLTAQIALLPDGPWYDSLPALAGNPVMERRLERRAAAGIRGTLIVPSVIGGKVNGCYFISFKEHRQFRQEELGLTRAMVHLATLAHQLYRLLEQSREAAVLSERNRMARDIHDTLAQGFTGVIMQLEAAKDAMQREEWSVVDEHVGRAGKQARASLGDARRSVVALRPHSVQEGQFRNALNDLLRRLADGSRVRATFQVEGEERPLTPDWEDNLLRIAQEAFNNTLKYAKAKTFRATLKYLLDRIEFQLVDDGSGFDISQPHDGFGLVGMRERVNGMKGRFSLQSGLGQGTEIRVMLDLRSS